MLSVFCDGCIILDSILVIQTSFLNMLFVTEGTGVVVNLIADDVGGSEYEITGALSGEV